LQSFTTSKRHDDFALTDPASADVSMCASFSISRFRSPNRRSIVQHSREKRMAHKNKQKVRGNANFILDSTSRGTGQNFPSGFPASRE